MAEALYRLEYKENNRMSTARDNGLAALQSGDFQTAISQLELAVQEDASDYDAFAYLGGAYSQAARHMDAIKAFTSAVHLQPANPKARYNLGYAMEQAGYEEQALQVYDQAIQLQHDYPDAHDALKRLEARSNDGFGAPPPQVNTQFHHTNEPAIQTQQTQVMQSPFAQPSAQPEPAPQAQPAAFGAPQQQPQQPAQQFGAPQQQPTQQFGAPAQQPTQQFGAPQQPAAFGAPQQPQEAGLASYSKPPASAPPPQAPFGQSPAYGAPGGGIGARPSAAPYRPSVPEYEDTFNPITAFVDMFKAMFTPRKFFGPQVGCEGMAGPWAMVLVFLILMAISRIAASAMLAGGFGAAAGLISVGISCVMLPVIWLVYAFIVKLLAGAFGSQLGFGASFRCVVYAAAPFMLVSVISSFVGISAAKSVIGNTGQVSVTQVQYQQPTSPFGSTGQSRRTNPYGTNGSGTFSSSRTTPDLSNLMAAAGGNFLLSLVGMVWSWIILTIGLSEVHELSGGTAAGVVVLSVIVCIVIIIGLGIVIGILGGAALMSMARGLQGG